MKPLWSPVVATGRNQRQPLDLRRAVERAELKHPCVRRGRLILRASDRPAPHASRAWRVRRRKRWDARRWFAAADRAFANRLAGGSRPGGHGVRSRLRALCAAGDPGHPESVTEAPAPRRHWALRGRERGDGGGAVAGGAARRPRPRRRLRGRVHGNSRRPRRRDGRARAPWTRTRGDRRRCLGRDSARRPAGHPPRRRRRLAGESPAPPQPRCRPARRPGECPPRRALAAPRCW